MRKIVGITISFLLLVFIIYSFYPEDRLPLNVLIDQIVVYKSKRQLLVYSKGKWLKTYKISLGKSPVGSKQFEGDKKTPEGIYFINGKNSKSGYHKNLGISYPNQYDIENAKRLGKPTGGDVKIHGLKNNIGFVGKHHRWFDWTKGCIAVTNQEMDELYRAVNIGTKIEIKP